MPAWLAATVQVPAATSVFSASVRENLRLWDGAVDDAALWRALGMAELRGLVGVQNVLSHGHELLVYECDGYTLEKRLPGVVVLPRTTAEVQAVVKLCAAHGLPIIPRGAGTSLSGTVLASTGGVMIALTRMNRILDLDVRNRRLPIGHDDVGHFNKRTVAQILKDAVDQTDGDFNFLVLHGFLLVVNGMPWSPMARAIVPELG